jgi:hypothetical protein
VEVAGRQATPASSQAGAAADSTPGNRRPPDGELVQPLKPTDEPLWPYLVAGPLVAALGAGGYYYSKRKKS